MRKPRYHGLMEPVFPCREMPTRHCPAVYEGTCGERPCARYESSDEAPWLPELDRQVLPETPGLSVADKRPESASTNGYDDDGEVLPW